MALHRENGKEQPFIPAGPFKIRIPFIHYRWEISECLQAILMCATCLGAIPVLQELLGVPYEVAWSMVIINGFFYNLHSLLGDPVVPGWITPAIPLVTAFLTLTEQGPERVQTMIALQLVVGLIFLFMGITGLASKIIGAIPNAIKAGILLGAGSPRLWVNSRTADVPVSIRQPYLSAPSLHISFSSHFCLRR